ncbi:MAG TPA: ATP-binding protein [Kofleriaceae bacterium]|jgi:PAS domain S-box-containing protein
MTGSVLADFDVGQLWPAIEAASDQLGLGIYVIRVDAHPPYVLHVSERAARMVGRTPQALSGAAPWTILVPEDRVRVRDLMEARDPDKPLRIHVEAERPDGARVPIELGVARIHTRATGVLSFGYLRDLTSEREVLDALQQSEQRFRSLVEAAPDGVVILRRARIVFINPAAARLFGVSTVATALGHEIAEFLPPSEGIGQLAGSGQPGEAADAQPNEYRTLADPGRVVEIKAIACQWEGTVATLALARDVTERKALQAKLAHADRLAALGTLAAGVAHEINNPLTYAVLSLQRIERELKAAGVPDATAGAVRDLVANVQHGIARVAAITSSLRTFARADDTPPGPVDVTSVVERALKMVDHDLRHRAQLVRRFSPVPPVTGNGSRLEQVVVNVLLNAIQSIPHAGNGSRIEVSIEPTGDTVVVAIRDTGRGIPPSVRDRVFDPFFTTKPIGEGMGLGLAVCRGIVESIGGKIALESTEGVGTTVALTLRVDPIAALASLPPAEPLAPSGARLRVLLVDDDPFVRDTLARLLAQHHDVTTADGGEAALSYVASGRFDAILCDMMMPEISGREVYYLIAATHPGLERRIIFITGGTLAPDLPDFLAETGNVCLMKPFAIEQVLAVVASFAA